MSDPGARLGFLTCIVLSKWCQLSKFKNQESFPMDPNFWFLLKNHMLWQYWAPLSSAAGYLLPSSYFITGQFPPFILSDTLQVFETIIPIVGARSLYISLIEFIYLWDALQILPIKVWSPDQQHQHVLEACWKCTLSDPIPDLLNQPLHFNKIPR